MLTHNSNWNFRSQTPSHPVTEFYVDLRGKIHCPTSTMTVALAAGDSFPPFYLGPMLASTTDNDEAWVLQAPGPRFPKISTSTSHGTPKAVETHVENSPFLPLDNRRHETKRSTAPATTPSSFPYNSCSISTIDKTKPAGQSYDPDEGWSPIVCKCPFAFCRGSCPTAASLWKNQQAPLLSPTTFRSIIDDAKTQRQHAELAAIRRQLRENMADLDRLLLPSIRL